MRELDCAMIDPIDCDKMKHKKRVWFDCHLMLLDSDCEDWKER